MRIASFTRDETGSYGLSLSAGSRNLRAVLVSPLDFRMHLIELPPVSDEHLEGSARIKLRSLYPGSLDGLAIDVPARQKNAAKVDQGCAKTVVFAAENSAVADCRAHGAALIHPFAILSRYAHAFSSKGQIGIMVTEEWREYVRFSDGYPVLEAATVASASPPLDEARTLFGLDDLSRMDIFIIRFGTEDPIVRPTDTISAADSSHDSARETNARSCRSFDLGTLLEIVREIEPAKDGIFYPSREKKRLRGRIAAYALIAANVIAFFALTEIRIAASSRELAKIKAQYSLHQDKIEAIRKAREEIKAVEKIEKKSINAIPSDPYSLLSALVDGLVNVEIRSLTVDGSAFQFTATAPDAVRVLSCIAAKPSFRKVSIQQSAKTEDGKELFTITGEIYHVAE